MSLIIKSKDKTIVIQKFNPYHGRDGRFSSATSAASFTIASNKYGMERKLANAKARETKRTAAMDAEKKENRYEFKPAKTIAEATSYAHDTLGIENVRFGKLNVDTANQINQSLTEHFNDYPLIKKNIQFVGSIQQRSKMMVDKRKEEYYKKLYDFYKSRGMFSDEDCNKRARETLEDQEKAGAFKQKRTKGTHLAESSFGEYREKKGTQGISVNEKYGSKKSELDKISKDGADAGFHPKGCTTAKSVIDHELGHQIDALTGAKDNPAIQKIYNDIDAAGGKSAMKASLSTYAHQSAGSNPNRYSEFIAEAWSEYKNNPSCRDTAKQVGNIIDGLYNNKHE